jgi:hypothetical protein
MSNKRLSVQISPVNERATKHMSKLISPVDMKQQISKHLTLQLKSSHSQGYGVKVDPKDKNLQALFASMTGEENFRTARLTRKQLKAYLVTRYGNQASKITKLFGAAFA